MLFWGVKGCKVTLIFFLHVEVLKYVSHYSNLRAVFAFPKIVSGVFASFFTMD